MKLNAVKIAAAAAVLTMLPGYGSSSPPKGRGGAAATARTPEEVASAAPFRISGAALMMTPAEVAAVLKGAGYSLSDKVGDGAMMDSFEDQVQARVTGRPVAHPTVVPWAQTWRKDQESIHVTYGTYPGAPKAVDYKWSTDAPSPTDAEIVSTIEKRYGPGWRLKPFLSPSWCSPMPCGPSTVYLEPGHASIELTAPSHLYSNEADRQRVDAAAAARTAGRQGSF